jgi:hypothetical protein
MTRPAYDVDLDAWRAKFAFHPADSRTKQLGHQLARKAVMALADLLHWLVPPSDDKSTAFRLLGDVLMYSNRALAVNGGPRLIEGGGDEYLEQVLEAALASYAHTQLPEDPRIREYEREQLAAPDATGQTSGPVVTPAAEPGVYAEQDTAPADRFEAEFEDGDVTLRVIGGRDGVSLAVVGPQPPPADRDGGREYGWYFNADKPQSVNQILSAIAAAGERGFGHR